MPCTGCTGEIIRTGTTVADAGFAAAGGRAEGSAPTSDVDTFRHKHVKRNWVLLWGGGGALPASLGPPNALNSWQRRQIPGTNFCDFKCTVQKHVEIQRPLVNIN